MHFAVLALDYDGTIAMDGSVADSTARALRRIRESGRKLVLVTGRIISDLIVACDVLDLFDYVVAENGAVLYKPATREIIPLAEAPPARFIDELRARRVFPLSTGEVIVATSLPQEHKVLTAIRDFGLELNIIFNKGSVMVLPAGVNKGSGLAAALHKMQLSPHNAIGIGDAENDHAFLELCECSVAVGNALPAVKDRCDLVMASANGRGVAELISLLLAGNLPQT
jgi:HAD superfamily hydrolase (TIGR01484 family)